MLDPGEWVDLPLTLANNGSGPATTVRARVESLSPYVEVITAQANLPDLAPGAQAATTAPHLRIRVKTDLPCATSVGLRFTYESAQGARSEDADFPTGGRTTLAREDFEGATSWAHVASESTATAGAWIVGDPVGTGFQPEDDASPAPGTKCLCTAREPGAPPEQTTWTAGSWSRVREATT